VEANIWQADFVNHGLKMAQQISGRDWIAYRRSKTRFDENR
jgi:hypothetical protein